MHKRVSRTVIGINVDVVNFSKRALVSGSCKSGTISRGYDHTMPWSTVRYASDLWISGFVDGAFGMEIDVFRTMPDLFAPPPAEPLLPLFVERSRVRSFVSHWNVCLETTHWITYWNASVGLLSETATIRSVEKQERP
ncbi:hypothetical protein GGI11_008643 [Coemansia sp. RSA 2049]|nr:hypothetical protein GGI11_008643 [Coemansia sp. RSA 2049]